MVKEKKYHTSAAIFQPKCLVYAFFVGKMSNGVYALWWAGLAQKVRGRQVR